MNLKHKVKRLAITIAVTLGVFTGLLVFIASYNSLQDARFQIPLSLLAGLFYFGIAFGAVMGVYRILEWVSLGFHGDKEEDQEAITINLREGSRRSALVLAIIAAVLSALFASSIPLGEYYIAKNGLSIFESQHKEYEGKAYYDYMQRRRLKDNYWLNLHKGQLMGICVSAGLVGAAAGFCIAWVGYKFLERLILNIWCGKGKR
jgi:hypothetical protein